MPHVSYPSDPQLIHYPHPSLRRRAEAVTVFDDDLRTFCQRLFAVMERERGIGLAAPQVDVGYRIFITDHQRTKESDGPQDPRVWINPRLERCEGSTVYEEGCLSFPGIYAKVQRHNRFDIIYQDGWGRELRQSLDIEAGDFLGIVVQHELDHLDGKVFVDLLNPLQLGLIRRRLRELESAYRKRTGRDGTVLRR
jgi:peptide deformylase